jgi:hypothetical protein
MKTNIHFRSYLAHFFLEWEMFQMEVVEKIITHFVLNNFFPPVSRAVYEIMWKKYGRARQDTDDNIIRSMLCLSLITKDAHTHTKNM